MGNKSRIMSLKLMSLCLSCYMHTHVLHSTFVLSKVNLCLKVTGQNLKKKIANFMHNFNEKSRKLTVKVRSNRTSYKVTDFKVFSLQNKITTYNEYLYRDKNKICFI